ncbi:metal-dependent HD superfamily phosphatase/phosphodiesterase [Halorubrum trapanicum]|uniref:Metal-dependent HD superfamily phosphatase/phosphodiesterase n=1 Tax=Halorubrum trapanicum TaxID=29284 RepID=A0A8J7R869_9EURY|nr:HD domain-containing protein [Halorubrum trapanicum]MBP1902346.1 metal-dependent HD superfamily phosphatase/phosphodiesterase [Halorubrum trapanicum]
MSDPAEDEPEPAADSAPDPTADDAPGAHEEVDADTDAGRHEYDPDADHAFPDDRLNEVMSRLTSDEEILAYLEAQNVNPVARKGYNDHGSKHVEIVRDRALRLYDLLKAGGVEFNGARQQGLDEADEPVVIALAATLHDIGHVVHRHDHPYYSIPLAADLLDDLLPAFYDVADQVRVKAEVLHAILCHHTEEQPLTLEAGVVRIADGLDMERGRSRVPYEEGGRGINTVSSQAIERVSLREGDETPVQVVIRMNNAAGVYQVDSLLKAKIDGSLLEAKIRTVAINTHSDGVDGNEAIVDRIEL